MYVYVLRRVVIMTPPGAYDILVTIIIILNTNRCARKVRVYTPVMLYKYNYNSYYTGAEDSTWLYKHIRTREHLRAQNCIFPIILYHYLRINNFWYKYIYINLEISNMSYGLPEDILMILCFFFFPKEI